jgi:hypothetical protein
MCIFGRKRIVLKFALRLQEGIINVRTLYSIIFLTQNLQAVPKLPELTVANNFCVSSNSNHNIKKIAEIIN